MRRIKKVNPNTEKYWDGAYKSPPGEGMDVQKNEIIANHITTAIQSIPLRISA